MDSTILLRRSANLATAANIQLKYGEPLYTDDQYVTVGDGNESLVKNRNVLRLVPKAQADTQLYYSVNPDGKIVLDLYKNGSVEHVVTFGTAATHDVLAIEKKNSNDVITSGAVYKIKDDLIKSDTETRKRVEDLKKSVASVANKKLDTSVTPTSQNPVTAKAVYDFVTQAINEAITNYVPWTTTATDTNKFYINGTNGLQYNPGTGWKTVPVGYT